MACEILFNPYIGGKDNIGITDAFNNTIARIDSNERRFYYSKIFLTGGNTKLKGFHERFHKELYGLAEDEFAIEILKNK